MALALALALALAKRNAQHISSKEASRNKNVLIISAAALSLTACGTANNSSLLAKPTIESSMTATTSVLSVLEIFVQS